MRIGLSTTWNAFRHTSGKSLILEIKDAGFERVELGFNLTSGMVSEIKETAEENAIDILSLHNYCPIPDGVAREVALPDFVSLASTDEAQRRKAVEYTRHTIATAGMLGAKAAVLHCGRVEMPDKTRELIGMYTPGAAPSGEFLAIRDQHIRDRESLARPHFDNALRSLEELCRTAEEAGVLLGIENRFYYREIPSFDEISTILARFNGAPIAYWHDTGHAQVMENLGFSAHEEHLRRYSPRMAGMHLHDIAGCKDHQPIGKGTLDFPRILSYSHECSHLILEIHRPATKEDLKNSRDTIESICNE